MQDAWSPAWSFHNLCWFGEPCHLLVLVHCALLRPESTQPVYQDILEHFMLSSADNLYGDADFIFQQDLAPAHTAKTTKTWFNYHGITVLDWPANSPDLNPIENLWGIAKRTKRDMRPTNAKELKAAIEASWSSITPQQCHRLIASMPRRIKAVIHAKGAPTKYWVHMHDYTFHRANISLFKILFLLISCNILIFWDFEFGVFRSCTSLASKL